MLDFICIGFADLFGTGKERKIQNINASICIQRDSNPSPKFELMPTIVPNINQSIEYWNEEKIILRQRTR